MALNQIGLGVILEGTDLLSGTLKSAGKNWADFEGATSKSSKSIKDNLGTLSVGVGLMAAGFIGLGLLSEPLEFAKQYGHELGQIRTIVDEATFSTGALEDVTMDLSAAYGGGAIKQANALYEVLSAGVTDAAQATDLLGIANQFAVGGATDLKAGVDVLTSAVNTYADQGLSATDASDSLFLAIAAGKTNATELAHSLGEVAPTAHAMGISFDELTGSIAALTVQGIKTPQAVTGLNAVIANIAKPTKDSADEAKRLGIEFNATALKTRGLVGVLGQLAGNTKVNDNTFTKLFGSIDGVKTALTLTSNGGAKLAEVLEQMKGKTGATAKAFEIMADTTEFQGDRLKALKQDVLTLIGQAVEPLAVRVMKLAATMLEAFKRIPAPVRETLVHVFAIGSAVLSVVGGALVLKSGLGILAAGLRAAGVSAAGFAGTLLPVVAVLAVVVGAVAAFKVAYEQNLGGFATFVDDMRAKVSLGLSAMGQLFEDGGFSGAVMNELAQADNQGVKNFVIRLYVAGARISEFFSSLGSGFVAVIGAAGPAFDAFMTSIQGLADTFSALWETNDPAEAESGFNAVVKAGTKVGSVLGTITVAVTNIATAAVDLISGLLSKMAPVGDLIVVVFDTVFSVIGELVSAFSTVDGATGKTTSGWRALGEAIGNIIGVIAGVAKILVTTLGGALKSAFNILGGIVDLFTGNVEKGITKILYGIISLISGLVMGAIELVAGASDSLLGTSWSKNVSTWRASMDDSLRKYTNMEPAKPKTAAGDTVTAAENTTPAFGSVAALTEVSPAAFPAAAQSEATAAAAPDFTQLYASVDGLKSAKEAPSKIALTVELNGEQIDANITSSRESRGDASFTPSASMP